MDKTMILLSVFMFVIQMARAQPNLAALFGLDFGNMAGLQSSEQSSASSSCPYQAHQDRRKFKQMVNNRMITQECAPGTMYVQSKCSCDNIPTGGSANGPMPGSDPRTEAALGSGVDPLLSALMSQLGRAFPPPTPRPSRPSPRNNSPMNTNQLNSVRQKVTSGIRPDQSNGGTIAIEFQKPIPAPSSNIQYNLDPNTGLTSVIDPSLLPNVLPPEILKILQGSNNAPSKPRKPRPTSGRKPRPITGPKPPARDTRLSSTVERMLERSQKPPTRRPLTRLPSTRRPVTRKQSPQTKSPPELQRDAKKKKVNRSKQRSTKKPYGIQKSGRKQTPPPRRAQSPTRVPGSRPDPLAGLMAQIGNKRRQQGRLNPSRGASGGPRKDPLAELLGGISQQSRPPTRSSNRGTQRVPSTSRGSNRSPARTTSKSSGSAPGGDPMAALFAGLGGGSNTASAGAGANPLASLMASMGGGAGSPNNLAAMMAGLGGTSNTGIPGAPGGSLNGAGLPGRAPGSVVDMTNFFNAQGMMRGTAGLSGLNSINYLKLRELDRQEVIDLGDLTTRGLLAANAFFSGQGGANFPGQNAAHFSG